MIYFLSAMSGALFLGALLIGIVALDYETWPMLLMEGIAIAVGIVLLLLAKNIGG